MTSDSEFDPAYAAYLAARAAFDIGDWIKSMTMLEQSLGLSVHYKSLELYGECLICVGNVMEAIKFLKRAIALNPRSDKTACLLAKAMFASGADRSSIVVMLEEVLSRNPTYGPARALLAKVVSSSGS